MWNLPERGGGVPFIHRLADLGPVLDGVRTDTRNVGVLIDPFHLFAAGEDVGTVLDRWGDQTVWVHLADLPAEAPTDRSFIQDRQRGLPSEHGAVANRKLLEQIARRSYDGPVTVDTLSACSALNGLEPRQAVLAIAETIHQLWPADFERAARCRAIPTEGEPVENLSNRNGFPSRARRV